MGKRLLEHRESGGRPSPCRYMRVPSGRRVRNRLTESVNVPRWSSDPTGAEELAADRLFVAPRTAPVHATDDDDDATVGFQSPHTHVNSYTHNNQLVPVSCLIQGPNLTLIGYEMTWVRVGRHPNCAVLLSYFPAP